LIKYYNNQDKSNKSVEPINYPAGNLLAHFKRYLGRYASEITSGCIEHPNKKLKFFIRESMTRTTVMFKKLKAKEEIFNDYS